MARRSAPTQGAFRLGERSGLRLVPAGERGSIGQQRGAIEGKTEFPAKRAEVRIASRRLSGAAIAIRALPIRVDAQGLAMLPLKTAERDGVRM